MSISSNFGATAACAWRISWLRCASQLVLIVHRRHSSSTSALSNFSVEAVCAKLASKHASFTSSNLVWMLIRLADLMTEVLISPRSRGAQSIFLLPTQLQCMYLTASNSCSSVSSQCRLPVSCLSESSQHHNAFGSLAYSVLSLEGLLSGRLSGRIQTC